MPVIFIATRHDHEGGGGRCAQSPQILADLGVSNYYIHADAALSGMILPFVDEPQPYGFDAGIDSDAVSGHK